MRKRGDCEYLYYTNDKLGTTRYLLTLNCLILADFEYFIAPSRFDEKFDALPEFHLQ